MGSVNSNYRQGDGPIGAGGQLAIDFGSVSVHRTLFEGTSSLMKNTDETREAADFQGEESVVFLTAAVFLSPNHVT